MISTRQLGIMVALSRVSVMTIFLPVVTAANALEDAPLAAGLAVLASLPLVYMLGALARRFSHSGLVGSAKNLLGAPLGTAVSLVLGGFFFVLAFLRTRQLAFALINSILPQVPTWVMAVSILIAGAYGAITGVDSLGRAAELMITLVGATILAGIVLALVSGVGDFRLLLPVLTRGLEPVAVAAVNPVFWFATSASIVVILGEYCDDPKGIPRTAVWATAATGLLLIVFAVLANAILGPRLAVLSLSPVHSIARTIYYRGILERLDILAISLWVLGVAFDTALFFLCSLIIVRGVFPALSRGVAAALLTVSGGILVSQPFADIFAIRRVLGPTFTGIVLIAVHLVLFGGMHLLCCLLGKGKSS